MTRRSAVTLMEVLVTMFIMAIGMLALLVLFPVGAVSMAKALKDDRCASAASMAEQLAIAMNVRQDPLPALVLSQFASTVASTPSLPVYVDPVAVESGVGIVGFLPPAAGVTMAGIPALPITRTTLSFIATPANPLLPQTPQAANRWMSLPNDIAFLPSGMPDTIQSGGYVERGRQYSWAYLLQRPQVWSPEAVNLIVVVYRKRPIVPSVEQTYSVSPIAAQGTSGLVLNWNPLLQAPTLKRGVWLLDTTPIVPGSAIPMAKFYRIVNVSDSKNGVVAVDVQPNLVSNVSQVVVMDYVAEVFDKGTSWQP